MKAKIIRTIKAKPTSHNQNVAKASASHKNTKKIQETPKKIDKIKAL